MSAVQFEIAKLEDYEEIIVFADLIFSHAYAPHNFLTLLPKLYKREYFMEGIHYIVRESGVIKAVVGAYPLDMEFTSGPPVPGRGIGMVSVHPHSRSKGYMKALMNMAMEDMKKDGMVFSGLLGQRQRYEYERLYKRVEHVKEKLRGQREHRFKKRDLKYRDKFFKRVAGGAQPGKEQGHYYHPAEDIAEKTEPERNGLRQRFDDF